MHRASSLVLGPRAKPLAANIGAECLAWEIQFDFLAFQIPTGQEESSRPKARPINLSLDPGWGLCGCCRGLRAGAFNLVGFPTVPSHQPPSLPREFDVLTMLTPVAARTSSTISMSLEVMVDSATLGSRFVQHAIKTAVGDRHPHQKAVSWLSDPITAGSYYHTNTGNQESLEGGKTRERATLNASNATKYRTFACGGTITGLRFYTFPTPLCDGFHQRQCANRGVLQGVV